MYDKIFVTFPLIEITLWAAKNDLHFGIVLSIYANFAAKGKTLYSMKVGTEHRRNFDEAFEQIAAEFSSTGFPYKFAAKQHICLMLVSLSCVGYQPSNHEECVARYGTSKNCTKSTVEVLHEAIEDVEVLHEVQVNEYKSWTTKNGGAAHYYDTVYTIHANFNAKGETLYGLTVGTKGRRNFDEAFEQIAVEFSSIGFPRTFAARQHVCDMLMTLSREGRQLQNHAGDAGLCDILMPLLREGQQPQDEYAAGDGTPKSCTKFTDAYVNKNKLWTAMANVMDVEILHAAQVDEYKSWVMKNGMHNIVHAVHANFVAKGRTLYSMEIGTDARRNFDETFEQVATELNSIGFPRTFAAKQRVCDMLRDYAECVVRPVAKHLTEMHSSKSISTHHPHLLELLHTHDNTWKDFINGK